jgi:hypothetical protein
MHKQHGSQGQLNRLNRRKAPGMRGRKIVALRGTAPD